MHAPGFTGARINAMLPPEPDPIPFPDAPMQTLAAYAPQGRDNNLNLIGAAAAAAVLVSHARPGRDLMIYPVLPVRGLAPTLQVPILSWHPVGKPALARLTAVSP